MQSQEETYHLLEIRPLSFDQAQFEFQNGQNRMWKQDLDNYGANPSAILHHPATARDPLISFDLCLKPAALHVALIFIEIFWEPGS